MTLINKYYKKIIIILCVILLPLIIWFVICLQVPKDFPQGTITIHIAKNSSISSVASDLYSKNIINSEFLFKVFAKLLSWNSGVFTGDYRFTQSQNLAVIAYRMVNGLQGLPKVKVTIPEGTNTYDMAFILMSRLENFDAPHFVAVAQSYEGYLFPDTYYFLSNTSAEQIVGEMRANFDKKIKEIQTNISKSGKSLKDTITMASIIEEEAKGMEDKRMVSGILWNRIDSGMLLQVDPPFYYITGKTGGVAFDDLKVDSPYNTYKYKGLPKGPISNPGIESIKATIDPIKTSYYFYLTGKDGVMRYATTYEGHLLNKERYLD